MWKQPKKFQGSIYYGDGSEQITRLHDVIFLFGINFSLCDFRCVYLYLNHIMNNV